MEATNPERLQRFIPEEFRIERVHDITPEDFINLYYNLQKPVILTGLATKWPAVQVEFVYHSLLTVVRNGPGTI